ncbi:MAG: hypothetical protein IPG45_25565 [Deltaproteobacteria bacterium]|jgi:hypothetical protein|nr:hypothetical protein [Deltaproteobacteria bacterium]
MVDAVNSLGLARRSEWDYSDRNAPMVNAMLRSLAEERDPVEKQGIVDRLTDYLEGRRPEDIDFNKINTAFAAAGFGPLPYTPEQTQRRPRSEMPPGLEAAFQRFEELGRYAHGRDGRLVGELFTFVRKQCGEALNQAEFDEAVRALQLLPRS